MEVNSPAPQTTYDRCCSDVYTRNFNMVQGTHLFASSNENKDITIITDEGDKVTLSYDRQTEASYDGLKALSYQGAMAASDTMAMVEETLTRIQAEQFSFENSQNLTLKVEGDLNEQELADIKTAIKKIDEIMTDLLGGGDISEAAIDMEALKNLGSLSSFEADYSYEREVLMEHYVAKEMNTSSEYRSPERIGRRRHGKGPDALERLAEKMAEFIENAKVKPHKFFKPVKHLFGEFSERFNEDNADHRAKRHIAGLVESALMEKIDSLAAIEQSEAMLLMA